MPTTLHLTHGLTHDGPTLAIHFYPPAQAPAPGVVICHGFGSRRENHADLAELLAAHGYAVCVPDLRGHGESGGTLDGDELDDLLAALDLLSQRPEVGDCPLGLRGSSMGGRLVLQAAAQRPRVRAIVAVCAAQPATFRQRLADPAWVGAARAAGVRLDPETIVGRLPACGLEGTVASLAGRALLFVHAEGDETVPVAVSHALHAAATEPKRLLLLPGGDHGTAQHHPAAHVATIAWFDEHLRCPR